MPKIPRGTPEFREAVRKLQKEERRATNSELRAMVNSCCHLCTSRQSCDDCDDCYIGKVGERADGYKEQVCAAGGGMYTTGMFRGKDGKYGYSHNGGG